MSDPKLEWIAEAVAEAAKAARFCTSGTLPVTNPGLEVEGVGPLRLPLMPRHVKQLVAQGRPAPYGKGTQTLVDPAVRKTHELEPSAFRLSDAWNAAVAHATHEAAEQLGLPPDRLEARLYKLLVYERGGFFLAHRDSEKHNGMVASLVVVLPNPFEGGTLVVRHRSLKRSYPFKDAAKGKDPCYAAFYADCEHEVERVERGVRLALAYNLVLKPSPSPSPSPKKSPGAKAKDAPDDALAAALRAWNTTNPDRPLVFALEHHYTERGLSLDLLKGADRPLADRVVAAAEQGGCLVHLAQVSRHLSQFADDGSFARSYSRGYSRDGWTRKKTLEIGETYEDDLHGSEWADVKGRKQSWGSIPLDLPAIVSSIPIEDWKPTSEDFEGYTGNAGNTLDRWYHRSALVVWHPDSHFEILARAGAEACIPSFCEMAAKLARTPKTRREAAHLACVRFARAIIARWPHRGVWSYRHKAGEASPLERFPEALLSLHDRDTVARFLSKLAELDQVQPLAVFIEDACREHGWDAFTRELQGLIASPTPPYHRAQLLSRDAEWLCAFCCEKAADPVRVSVAKTLCAAAVDRFCTPFPPDHREDYRTESERAAAESTLLLLLKAVMAEGDADLPRLVRFVQGAPAVFPLGDCQFPCLRTLIPWSRKRFGQVPAELARWLADVRRELEEATARQPEPPPDWARPADVACTCQCCAQLKRFLADPASQVGRIPAREDLRRHLVGMIERHRCDVDHRLEASGSPYSLVLTKNQASYERGVTQYKANLKMLGTLPTV